MDDRKVGRAIRALRVKRSWRQDELGAAAGVSRQLVSKVECGRLSRVQVETVRKLADALGCRLELHVDSPSRDLDRLLNARHAGMHEAVARLFQALPGWVAAPEVSFAVYGERGVIDVLAYHEAARAILIVELKTAVVDINDLLVSMDRRMRLAPRIARDRGWRPASMSAWVLIADGATNRRRVAAHGTVLRAAFPDGGRQMHAWLRAPTGRVAALSFTSDAPRGGATRPRQRVRHAGHAQAARVNPSVATSGGD